MAMHAIANNAGKWITGQKTMLQFHGHSIFRFKVSYLSVLLFDLHPVLSTVSKASFLPHSGFRYLPTYNSTTSVRWLAGGGPLLLTRTSSG
ncbi:hypothetical protein Cni_G04779 [Canna indica]|uniref:Uncharacterized protein n=1 Tax=Canna indica TaxID=4628 RepID=A0AAQ3JU27_9LILI|nr:hypothetical protein Cni_G04779 [Canna indica]